MEQRIKKEIEQFSSAAKALGEAYLVEELVSHVWKISPKSELRTDALKGKSISLAILGVTHGNELAGLAVVNQLLSILKAGVIDLKIPIVVGLGNPRAAVKNSRFIEKDLNRSFMNEDNKTIEGKRARELEGFLKDTYRLLDFHQTLRKCEEPFFIFPYTKDGYEFARNIDPSRSIVTHWGDSFSTEGGCTDEYVNKCGGSGISYELGQNGFDDYQIALGVQAAIWSIAVVTQDIFDKETSRSYEDSTKIGSIYTWEKTVAFPTTGRPELDPGWYNFKKVEKGEKVGSNEGQPIISEASGRMLFPKYLKKDEDLKKRPTELFRVMKEITVDALPK